MINKVISGVCTSLYEAFGDDYAIYKEEIKQGLTPPCFLVECYLPRRTQVLNNRYYRQNGMAIHYFPKSAKYKSECNEVLEKLYLALEYITIDNNLTRGLNLRKEYSDGIMIVFVDYDFYTFEGLTEQSLMEELIQIN